jgi:hypothetical protein
MTQTVEAEVPETDMILSQSLSCVLSCEILKVLEPPV